MHARLLERLESGQAKVVVMGAGYVGLPLAVELARSGLSVTALDSDPARVAALGRAESYVRDVPAASLAPLVEAKRLRATADVACLANADAVLICVPTPLNKSKDPDVSYILDATDAVAARAPDGCLVALESTTYPGTTREIVAPRLERAGKRIGDTVFLAFSPERIDPGNPVYTLRNTPKIVSGMTEACLRAACALYAHAVDTLVPVSSPDAAEMTKLLENTFRAVNIGLVNEVALMCERLGLDTWEVIDAAGTKPFGFMRFYPGPGLGGHCIPVDPLYLSWKLRTLRYTARFVELADEINRGMPEVVVRRVTDALNDDAKAVRGARILVLGVAYKKDVDDVRESPALDCITLLVQRGAELEYHDPLVPKLREHGLTLDSVPSPRIEEYDCVLLLTDHSALDLGDVTRRARLLVDTRNATRDVPPGRARIVKL